MVIVVTLVAVLPGNAATIGFGLYSYSGLKTLLALIMVVTQPKYGSVCMLTLPAVVTGNVITAPMYASMCIVTLVSVIAVNAELSV